MESGTLAERAPGVPREGLRTLVRAARLRQWTKNLLLFAGLLWSAKLGDGHRWLEAGVAFAAFSFASSAAYLVNDVRDAERDRLHPVKRHRPVARGALSPTAALAIAAGLAAAALLLGLLISLQLLLFVLAFLGLQLAYSLSLKEFVGIDVLAIAALFVLRAAAGAEAVEVRVSGWLLACTALLALFLALAKRRGELLLVHRSQTTGRKALDGYSVAVLGRLLPVIAAVTLGAYCAYVVEVRDPFEMSATIPFVAIAIGRYGALVRRDAVGEEPETVLLTDPVILGCVLVWAVTAGLILTLS